MLEDAGTDPGRRGATSVILMWQCACVGRWVTALWMTKTLLIASVKLRDGVNPSKLVNGPASSVLASMMRFRWKVLSGTECGTPKEFLSFASVGHGELHAVLQKRVRQMDLGADSRHWHWSAARLVTGQIKLALQNLCTLGGHLARGALQSVFTGTMRTQNLEWHERFGLLAFPDCTGFHSCAGPVRRVD